MAVTYAPMYIRYKQHINFIQLTKCVSCNEVGGCENWLFSLSSHAFCQHTAGFNQSVTTLMTQIHHSLHNHWMYFGGYCKWPAIPKIHHQDCVLQIIRKFNLSVNLAVRCTRFDVMNALLWMVHYFSRFISRGNLNHWMYFDGYCKVTSNGQDT